MNRNYRASPRSLKGLPVLAFLLLALSLFSIHNPCLAEASNAARLSKGEVIHSVKQRQAGGNFVVARVLIHAPVETVWEAIRKERLEDPDLEYSKLQTQLSQEEFIVEERFKILPIIHTATSRMLMHETRNQSITYTMLQSDHFIAMEGSWILTPSDDGHSTVVELSSHVEVDLPVPQAMVDHTTAKKLERRLIRVRNLSESYASRK